MKSLVEKGWLSDLSGILNEALVWQLVHSRYLALRSVVDYFARFRIPERQLAKWRIHSTGASDCYLPDESASGEGLE